jgi:hypothetical protein
LFLLTWSTTACGDEQSVCEEAADKLKACDVGRAQAEQGYARLPITITTEHCSGQNQCLAQCVTSATCEEIIAGMVGGSSDPNSPPVSMAFVGCVFACVE